MKLPLRTSDRQECIYIVYIGITALFMTFREYIW